MSELPFAAGAGAAVSVPGSSANLGSGFDAVGLGLELRDRYAVQVTATPGLVIDLRGEGADLLPRDETHLVAAALHDGLQAMGLPWLPGLTERGLGLHLVCRNAVPLAAGLGSSAAALAGGLGLGFALARSGRLTDADLALVNTQAGVAEGHPDNASASVYGGLTLSWMPSPASVRTARLRLHRGIEPVLLVPREERVATRQARAALPPYVSHGEAVQQASRAALLVHALTVDPVLLLDATVDWLHQEHRRGAYPAAMAAVDLLRSLGHAAVISGAGPSVLVLTAPERAGEVGAEVRSWGRAWEVLRPGVATHGLAASP